MPKDFKSSLNNNIKRPRSKKIENSETEIVKETGVVDEIIDINTTFIVEVKKTDKTDKRTVPLRINSDKLKRLDRACVKANRSRNELVNLMIDFCLDNLEITK